MIVGGLAALTGAKRVKEPWETGQPAALVLDAPEWPASFPLDAEHLSRIDQSPDTRFYAEPRLVISLTALSRTAATRATTAR